MVVPVFKVTRHLRSKTKTSLPTPRDPKPYSEQKTLSIFSWLENLLEAMNKMQASRCRAVSRLRDHLQFIDAPMVQVRHVTNPAYFVWQPNRCLELRRPDIRVHKKLMLRPVGIVPEIQVCFLRFRKVISRVHERACLLAPTFNKQSKRLRSVVDRGTKLTSCMPLKFGGIRSGSHS